MYCGVFGFFFHLATFSLQFAGSFGLCQISSNFWTDTSPASQLQYFSHAQWSRGIIWIALRIFFCLNPFFARLFACCCMNLHVYWMLQFTNVHKWMLWCFGSFRYVLDDEISGCFYGLEERGQHGIVNLFIVLLSWTWFYVKNDRMRLSYP